jgi:hypothetical protein
MPGPIGEARRPRGVAGGGEWTTIGGGPITDLVPSEKMKTALRAQVHCGVEKQTIADEQERITSKGIGIPRTKDNSAFDFRNKKTGVELKTMVDSRNGKITMSKAALGRKMAEAKSEHLKTYTVVADKRSGGTQYYVKEGLGSFRVGSMTRATLPQIRAMVNR